MLPDDPPLDVDAPDAVDPDDGACRWREPLGRRAPDGSTPARSALGRSGEDAALAHLVRVHGLAPVARNHRIAVDDLRGELDLVLRDPRTGLVVVCEVKTRVDAAGHGGAIAALGPRQRARIRRLAAALPTTTGLRVRGLRLDLVAVDVRGHGGVAALTHLTAAW